MGLNYLNLDDRTRHLAESEVDFDLQRGGLYLSPRLSDQGLSYEGLFRDALGNGTDDFFAASRAVSESSIPSHAMLNRSS